MSQVSKYYTATPSAAEHSGRYRLAVAGAVLGAVFLFLFSDMNSGTVNLRMERPLQYRQPGLVLPRAPARPLTVPEALQTTGLASLPRVQFEPPSRASSALEAQPLSSLIGPEASQAATTAASWLSSAAANFVGQVLALGPLAQIVVALGLTVAAYLLLRRPSKPAQLNAVTTNIVLPKAAKEPSGNTSVLRSALQQPTTYFAEGAREGSVLALVHQLAAAGAGDVLTSSRNEEPQSTAPQVPELPVEARQDDRNAWIADWQGRRPSSDSSSNIEEDDSTTLMARLVAERQALQDRQHMIGEIQWQYKLQALADERLLLEARQEHIDGAWPETIANVFQSALIDEDARLVVEPEEAPGGSPADREEARELVPRLRAPSAPPVDSPGSAPEPVAKESAVAVLTRPAVSTEVQPQSDAALETAVMPEPALLPLEQLLQLPPQTVPAPQAAAPQAAPATSPRLFTWEQRQQARNAMVSVGAVTALTGAAGLLMN